jgi:hypothetical protein
VTELLAGAALSALVFLFYLFVCLLLPAGIALIVTSRLPLVGRRADSWWLRLRKRLTAR